MYVEKINFPYRIPVSCEGWKGGSYHLHSHKDVIEIFMVIKGKANLAVSCENFEMEEGDYVVIRESDSHSFSAAETDCEIVSLYIRMQDHLDKIPYLYYVIFACESFDLAKYRNETLRIRNMIAAVVKNLIGGDPDQLNEAQKGAEDLLQLLVNDYDLIKYYNRKWDAPSNKIEKYYTIMGYIFNYYFMRDIREYISQNEFYSKSYITHLFKEVGASSFKDMLDYARIFKSEEMLLDSDLSINEIWEKCGFSDSKYYTANFKKWFRCTPSEYRKNAVKAVNMKSTADKLDSDTIVDRIGRLASEEREDTQYKAAITPISIKAFKIPGHGKLDGKSGSPDVKEMVAGGNGPLPMKKHYVQQRLGPELLDKTGPELASHIESYESSGFIAMLTVDLREMSESKCRDIIVKCIENFKPEGFADREIFILYNDLSQYYSISKLMAELKETFGFDGIKPLLMM